MVQLARLVMKIVLVLAALQFFTSIAELTCNTPCKATSFAADSMTSYSEDEAIKVVLCNNSCDNNDACFDDCLQKNHSWTRAISPSSEMLLPPSLIQVNSTAMYSVELPETLIDTIDGILLKMQPVDPSTITSYIPLMPNGEIQVSLASFECSKVIVSYATINSSVVSGYSEPTELCINQAFPVMKVAVSFKFDENLLGHAVLNVTWETSMHTDSLEYYVIDIVPSDTSGDCVDLLPLNAIIQPYENSYVIQTHVDRHIPRFGCNYSLTIIAIPSHHATIAHFYIPSDDILNSSTYASFHVSSSDSSSTLNLNLSSSLLASISYSKDNTALSVQNTDGFNLSITSFVHQITSQFSNAQTSSENIISSSSYNPNFIHSSFHSTAYFPAKPSSVDSMESIAHISTSINSSTLNLIASNSVFVSVQSKDFLDVLGSPSPTPNLKGVSPFQENGENIFHLPYKSFLDISDQSIAGTPIITQTPFLGTFPHVSITISPVYLVPTRTIQPTPSLDIMTASLQSPQLTMTASSSVHLSLSTSLSEVSATMATLTTGPLVPTPSQRTEKASSTALPTSFAAPTSVLSLQCTLNFNPLSGLYDLLAFWTIPANYSGRILSFFCEFTVQPFSLLKTDRIYTEDDQYQYSWIKYNNSPDASLYSLKVSPLPVPGDVMALSHPATCDFPVLVPVPPNPIISINISDIIYDNAGGTISLQITWERAQYTNGMLSQYQLYIGSVPLLPTESDQASASYWRNFISVRPYLTQLSLNNFNVPPNQRLLYLQMRQSNLFLFSNWSIPHILNLTSLSRDTSKVSDGLDDSRLPIFTFWAIGAGGSLIISFVFTLVCSCVFHTRQRRRFDYGTLFITGKRRRTTQKPDDRSAPFSDQDGFLSSTLSFDEWEIPRGEVTVMENEPLGKGFFGEVFKGEVTGFLRVSTSSLHSPMKASVAVKRLKRSANSIEKANFLKEIEMMKTVSQGGSELSMYVVNMVGCVTAQEPLLLLVEFVKYGDLLNYLRFVRKVMEDDPGRICPAIPYMEPRGVYSCLAPKEDLLAELGPVGDLDLLSFARQIAAGMEYLSGLNIVHRDLACRNILIGRNKLLKISDFGMSRVVMGDEVYINTSHGRLPLRWMAVESIFQREFTIASDVWAYGIVLWEIATMGGFPYASVSNKALTLLVKDGGRLERPSNCSNEIYNIMLDCWHDNPNVRPKFYALRRTMEQFLTTAAQYEHLSYFLEGGSQSPCVYQQQVAVPFPISPPEDVEDALEMAEIHSPLEWLNVATPLRSSPFGFEGSNTQALRRSAASSLHSVFSEPDCVEVRYVASPIHSMHSVHTSARQSVLVPSEHVSQDFQLGVAGMNDELSVQLGRKLSELSSNNEVVMDGAPLVNGNLCAEQARQD